MKLGQKEINILKRCIVQEKETLVQFRGKKRYSIEQEKETLVQIRKKNVRKKLGKEIKEFRKQYNLFLAKKYRILGYDRKYFRKASDYRQGNIENLGKN